MYLTYAQLTTLFPKYLTTPYTPQIVQLLLDRVDIIINSYLCRPINEEQITVTKQVIFDEIGCGLVLLPDCFIQSIDLVETSCDCTDTYTILETCDYRTSCEFGWVKLCAYGGCTDILRTTNRQCCARITYTRGFNPIPADFLQVYYAMLNQTANSVIAEYNGSVGCTVSDDIQPISDKLQSYSTEGESANFYMSEIDKALEDQGDFLIRSWMKNILEKYRCCNHSGIATI